MEHQQSSQHHSGHQHEALIRQLLECAQACEICGASCLNEKDVTPMVHCIALDRDCADLCFLAARILGRDSEYAHELLVLCEKACLHCAEVCGKHEHEHCKYCAEQCRKCAEACHAHHGKINFS